MVASQDRLEGEPLQDASRAEKHSIFGRALNVFSIDISSVTLERGDLFSCYCTLNADSFCAGIRCAVGTVPPFIGSAVIGIPVYRSLMRHIAILSHVDGALSIPSFCFPAAGPISSFFEAAVWFRL